MEKIYEGTERRHFKRLVVKLPVRLLLIDAKESRELPGTLLPHTVDISGGGLLFEISNLTEEWIRGLTSGMIRVGLELDLPTYAEPVRVLAKVAWLKKKETDPKRYLLGLNFIDITEEDRDKVLRYVVNAYLEKLTKK